MNDGQTCSTELRECEGCYEVKECRLYELWLCDECAKSVLRSGESLVMPRVADLETILAVEKLGAEAWRGYER